MDIFSVFSFFLSFLLLLTQMLTKRLSLVILFFYFHEIFAWGPVGHSLVARLAQSELTSSTKQWLNHYIPWDSSNDLSRVASWPDAILYPDSNPFNFNQWQWSRELHFVNIPPWNCQYLPSRDCVNDRCIEGALKNYSQRLIDPGLDYIQQQQALFFLVHFLGDIHQPLHSGFKNDFGGNAVKGFFLNGTNLTNLHSSWDVEIIAARIDRYFQSNVNLYYDYLKVLMDTLVINETYNDYRSWIMEDVGYVCGQVYLDDQQIRLNVSVNFTLGENYFRRNWPVVDHRLAQGGRRLANLLNRLVEHRSSMKLPPHIQALIVVLCIEILVVILAVSGFFFVRKQWLTKTDTLISEQSE